MVVEYGEAWKYLEESIEDENKIVTYKGLSRNLGLHVNTAKQLLYQFLEDYRHRHPSEEIHANYVISETGLAKDGHQVNRIVIVSEECLEKEKREISCDSSMHVYSIQKCRLKDCNPLYATDLWKAGDDSLLRQKLSGISFEKASTSSTRTSRAKTPPVDAQIPKVKEAIPSAKPTELSVTRSGETTTTAQPSSGNEKPNRPVKTKPKESKKAAAKRKQGSVLSLWSQRAKAQKPKVSDESQSLSTGTETPSSEAPETDSESMKAKLSSSDDEASDEEPVKVQNKRQNRILVPESSDSEADNQVAKETVETGEKSDSTPEGDSEDPIPPTPVEKQRTRVVRTVARVFADDEGFMVTKKVKENISGPEDEGESQEEEKPKPTPSSTPKAGPVKNAPKKQASLTSFFGKRA